MVRIRRIPVLGILWLGFLLWVSGAASAQDESAAATLRNQLFQYEKHLMELSQSTTLSPAERTARAESLQAKIKAAKEKLAGRFPPADLALAESVDAVREHGAAWILRYLTHGKYTGRKAEHHKPLEAVDIPGKNPDLAGRASLPLLGYPLMVILSYDTICREAYHAFIPQMEAIVRQLEKRQGRPCEFFDRQPGAIANDLGWDVDRFWGFAQECAGRVVDKYFWNQPADEIRMARNIVALVIVTGFLNNVTIDVAGDKETQSKRAFWRCNAAPWFNPDKRVARNRFKIFHTFTHAWLVFLKCLNDARYGEGKILSAREERPATRGMLRNAFWFSNVSGTGYEAISTFTGTKHGFLETTVTNELPKPLKKVAQALHLKQVVFYEASADIADNREGAWLGAALYLSKNPLRLSDLECAKALVMGWQRAAKDGDKIAEPEIAGPRQGSALICSGDRVSLFDLNTAEGKKRIQSGFFADLYRGMGAFNVEAHAAAELQAFKSLLGEDVLSYNLRQLYAATAAGTKDTAEAFRLAKQAHARIIAGHFSEAGPDGRAAIFRDLFSNEGQRASADTYNHEADYVYATHRADIAGCYGPIVLVIREKQPRGLDLNKIAAANRYYTFGRFLKSALKWRWKTMIGDYILDDEEYLLPSYLPGNEVTGVVVRSPKAKVISSHVAAADKDFSIALKAPPILRSYEKKMVGGFLVIDAFDGEKKLIERLSESPDHTPVEGTVAKSTEKIPAPILGAWKEYRQRTGR